MSALFSTLTPYSAGSPISANCCDVHGETPLSVIPFRVGQGNVISLLATDFVMTPLVLRGDRESDDDNTGRTDGEVHNMANKELVRVYYRWIYGLCLVLPRTIAGLIAAVLSLPGLGLTATVSRFSKNLNP